MRDKGNKTGRQKHRTLFTNELLKIITNRSFILFVATLLITNLVLLYTGSSNSMLAPSAYKQLQIDIKELSEEEKITYISEMNRQRSAMEQIYYEDIRSEIYAVHKTNESFMLSIGVTVQEYHKLRDLLHSGEYLTYTDNIIAEANLFRECYKEVIGVIEYDDYLKEIDLQAEQNSKISIFKMSGSDFSLRNLAKTAKDFKPLNDVKLTYTASKGVTKATQVIATDIIVILLIFITGIFIVIQEKEKNLFSLVRPTKNGRGIVAILKLTVLTGLCLFFTMIFWGGNLILSGCLYGFANMGKLIQSIEGFTSCSLSITVLQYILIFLVSKFAVYVLIGFVLFFFALSSRLSVFYIIKTIFFFGLSFLLYIMISRDSLFQLLKYINIINFMLVTPIYRYYFNLNIVHYPVNMITGFVIAGSLALIIISVINVRYFCMHDSVESNKLVAPKIKLHSKKAHTSIAYHELYKILIDNKVIWIILILIGFQIYISVQPKTPLTYIDFYYKKYVNALEGKITEEKLQNISEEQEAFDKVLQEIYALQKQFQNGKITETQLSYYIQAMQEEIKYIDGFNKLVERMNYINDYKEKTGTSLWLVYERGWYCLTAAEGKGYMRDISDALRMVAVMIVSFAAVFATEFSTGMIHIVSVCKHGRRDTFKTKIRTCIVITTVIFIITYLPECIMAARQYGLHSILAPLASLPEMKDSIVSGTILQYMLILFLMRYLTAIMIMTLILWISTWSNNMMICTVISTLVFAVPLMMHLLGIAIFDKFSFNAFLSGNMLINPSTNFVVLKIILLLTGFIIPIIIGVIFIRKNRKTFTMRGITYRNH